MLVRDTATAAHYAQPIGSISSHLFRFLRWAGSLRNAELTGRQRGLLFAAFGVATFFVLRDFPLDSSQGIRPLPIALSFLLIFGTIGFSAAAYRAQGLMLGLSLTWSECLRTQVMASAANLLPLPGSVIVRTGALVDLGAGPAAAASTTTISGLVWLGTSGLVAGPAFFATGLRPLGGVMTTISAALVVGSFLWSRRITTIEERRTNPTRKVTSWLTPFTHLGLATTGLVLTLGLRYLLLVAGLGIDASLRQVLALVIVGALASAVGFFPSGIGIREALAAAAASLVDLPAAVGYVVAAIDDVGLLAVIVGLSVVFVHQADPTRSTLAVQPEASHRVVDDVDQGQTGHVQGPR
jgi:hypothetical protein